LGQDETPPLEDLMKKDHPKLREELEAAAKDEQDRAAQQRNAGLAIAVLALVVVGILLAIVMGGTDAFRP
jgi:hypothetical protein